MKNHLTIASCTALLGSLLILTGCGGGGGSDSFTPPNISTIPVSITSSNQNDTVTTSETAITRTIGSPDAAITGVIIEGESSAEFNLSDYSTGQLLEYALQGKASAANLPVGVSFSQTIPCDSGNIRISGSVGDPNASQLSAGDSFTLSFNNCTDTDPYDGSTTTQIGSISLSIISGNIGVWCGSSCPDFHVAMEFNNFRATEMGSTATIHGGFNLIQTGATNTFSGTSLYLIEAGGSAFHLSNFNITTVTSSSLKTTTVSMTVASTEINGLINVETATGAPLEQYTYNERPHRGTLILTGSNNSVLTVEALDSTSVQLPLDSNRDGLPDEGYPKSATWTEIESQVPLIP
jgi:hypothetical protein